MSSLIVEVVPFSLEPCPNSDNLSIAKVKGWQCVVRTDDFKNVDKAIYIPIDALVPDSEKFAFLDRPDKSVSQEEHAAKLAAEGSSFVRKKNRRVKTIKLRGVISQGILLPVNDGEYKLGEDVSEKLGITKWEPPVDNSTYSKFGSPQSPFLVDNVSGFHKYTDIENIKNFPDIFEDGELVCFSEKIHGSNLRVGIILEDGEWKFYVGSHRKTHIPTVIRKIKKPLFKWLPFIKKTIKLESKNPFFYWNVVWKLGEDSLKDRLIQLANTLGVNCLIVFGEVFGKSVQDLNYGLEDISLRVFDISANGTYLDWNDMKTYTETFLGLEVVPVLGIEPFSKEKLIEHTGGMSTFTEKQIREGCVIKPLKERWHPNLGRVILKSISDEYLLRKGGTEDH